MRRVILLLADGGVVLMAAVTGADTMMLKDGSDGAGTGAAVGAGVAVLTKGKQIEIPAKSLIANFGFCSQCKSSSGEFCVQNTAGYPATGAE